MSDLGIKKLLIISHVRHYYYEGNLYAYAPYVEEIEIWAGLFTQILIASPCFFSLPSSDTKMFRSRNISIIPIIETGGNDIYQKIKQIALMPFIAIKLAISMKRVDAVHVRCPGNLGFLGILLAPLFSSYRIAKYAGQWNGFPEETWTTRLQRKILSSSWWNAPVTVYGNWPNQPKHVIPFFTSLLSDEILEHAQKVSRGRALHSPLRLIYVGRLTHPKNVHIILDALSILKQQSFPFEFKVIGDGSKQDDLLVQCEKLGLTGVVDFVGFTPFNHLLKFYEWADILILVSESEGWPKAIAEAMAFGIVCIGSNRGLIPQMLSNERGYVVEPGNPQQLADLLVHITSNTSSYAAMSNCAAEWSQQYTKSKLKSSLQELMEQKWNIRLA